MAPFPYWPLYDIYQTAKETNPLKKIPKLLQLGSTKKPNHDSVHEFFKHLHRSIKPIPATVEEKEMNFHIVSIILEVSRFFETADDEENLFGKLQKLRTTLYGLDDVINFDEYLSHEESTVIQDYVSERQFSEIIQNAENLYATFYEVIKCRRDNINLSEQSYQALGRKGLLKWPANSIIGKLNSFHSWSRANSNIYVDNRLESTLRILKDEDHQLESVRRILFGIQADLYREQKYLTKFISDLKELLCYYENKNPNYIPEKRLPVLIDSYSAMIKVYAEILHMAYN